MDVHDYQMDHTGDTRTDETTGLIDRVYGPNGWVKAGPDLDYWHSLVVEHTCGGDYDLTPEGCYRAEACARCGTRRDEHADQAIRSCFPSLDITDHLFAQKVAA